MIYKIPVHPLTRAVLLHDYEEEPIRPAHTDQLYHQLCYRPWDGSRARKPNALLTSHILIELPRRVEYKHSAHLAHVGHLLYLSDMDRMLHFIEAQMLITGNAWKAMELFYTKFELSEDDLAMESAYKRWQRYQSGLHYNIRATSKQLRNIYVHNPKVPMTLEMCDELHALALIHLHRYFYSYTGCYNLSTSHHLLAHIYRHYGEVSREQICKVMRIKDHSARDYISRGKRWATSDPVLSDKLDRLSVLVKESAQRMGVAS